MKLKSNQPKATAEQVVKDIRRATRRHYSTEGKISIVLSGLRGEDSIAELCRKEGIAQGQITLAQLNHLRYASRDRNYGSKSTALSA
jgi:transposase-like protein